MVGGWVAEWVGGFAIAGGGGGGGEGGWENGFYPRGMGRGLLMYYSF